MTKFYAGHVVEVHADGSTDPDYGFGRPPTDHIGGGPIKPPAWGSGQPVLPPLPGVWPPLTPDRPWHELPDGSPLPPGMIWPGANHPSNELPGTRPPHVGGGPMPEPKKFVVLVWISGGIGWNYVVIDPSLSAGTPLPETPEPK